MQPQQETFTLVLILGNISKYANISYCYISLYPAYTHTHFLMCTQQIWEGYGPLARLVLLNTCHNGSDLDFDELNSKGAPADLDGKKLHLKKSPLYTWRLCSWSRGLEWKADKTEGPKRNRPDPKLKESGINITWQYGKREPTCLLENTVPVCPVLQQSPFCDGRWVY